MHVEFDQTGRLVFHTIDHTELKALKAYSEELSLTSSNFLIIEPDHRNNIYNEKQEDEERCN